MCLIWLSNTITRDHGLPGGHCDTLGADCGVCHTPNGGWLSPSPPDCTTPNTPPNIDVFSLPAQASVGTPASFTATVSDLDGDPLTCVWDFGDGTQNLNCSGGNASTTHTYNAAGTYQVSLSVDDGNGPPVQRSGSVTVIAAPVNSPPVINQLNVPGSANVGDVVNFSASVSDQNDDPLTCTWLFGDGNQQNTNCTGGSTSVNYTYNSANSYTVTLRVDDGNNPFVEQSQNISIQPPPVTPPTANAGGPYSGNLMGGGMGMGGVTITFNGAGSNNPDGAVTAMTFTLSLIHISEPTRPELVSRMTSSA